MFLGYPCFILGLLMLLLPLHSSSSFNPLEARVAYFAGIYDEYTGEPYSPADGGVSQTQEAMVPLAALLFNERRGDIIPALRDLQCNKNLTVNWVCDAGRLFPCIFLCKRGRTKQ